MITAVRHAAFPATSMARIVTVLFPMRRGTAADQAVVPLAIPDMPKFVLQVTCVTPTLSLAVPFNVSEVAKVDSVAVEGEVIVREGGVVSTDARRITVMVFET